jgi:hypothetical protein
MIRNNQVELTGKKPLFTWLCSVSPLFLLLAFTTFGLHLRLSCGQWPGAEWKDSHYYHSGATLLRVHGSILDLAMIVAVVVAPLLWLVLLAICACRLSWREHCVQMGVVALGWGLFFAAVMRVPPRYLAWFLT